MSKSAEQTTWGALAQQLPQGDLMEIAASDSSTVCRLLKAGATGSIGPDQALSSADPALGHLDESEKHDQKRLEAKLLDWSQLLVALRTSRLLLVFMRAAVHKFLRRQATGKAFMAVGSLKRFVKTWQERRSAGKLLLLRVERRVLAKSLHSWVMLLARAARGFRIARKALRRRLTYLSNSFSPIVASVGACSFLAASWSHFCPLYGRVYGPLCGLYRILIMLMMLSPTSTPTHPINSSPSDRDFSLPRVCRVCAACLPPLG